MVSMLAHFFPVLSNQLCYHYIEQDASFSVFGLLIRHAQGEIRIALDVLTTIIASYQTANIKDSQQYPLPPGTLKCEYVTKVTVPLSNQISSEKLALGSKKNHLRKASQILMQGADNLKKVMENEDQFWEGALRLRKNNWSIGSKSGGAAPRVNRLGTGSQLSVYYGFGDGT